MLSNSKQIYPNIVEQYSINSSIRMASGQQANSIISKGDFCPILTNWLQSTKLILHNNSKTQMDNKLSLYITKHATFDPEKVKKFPWLLRFFQKEEEIPELHVLLQEQQNWEIPHAIEYDQNLKRQAFLECMVQNWCISINFKYFWEEDHHLLTQIKFSKLKELTFSVDSDCGYLKSIQFLTRVDAPELVRLDLSNMEDGGYSLSPLRRCFFPKLETLDLSYYATHFRDFQKLSQAYFPACRQIILQPDHGTEPYLSQAWKSKVQSPFLRKQFEEKLFPIRQNEVIDVLRKRIKQT